MEMKIIFGLMCVAFTLKWLLFIAHYLLWKWVLDLNKKNEQWPDCRRLNRFIPIANQVYAKFLWLRATYHQGARPRPSEPTQIFDTFSLYTANILQ